jgi:uncharacterized membrane protein YccC
MSGWFRRRARSQYVRLAVLSAGAAAVAYGVGALTPEVSPVVAGVTALITVRPTFHGSVQEALRQVLGVVLGAVLAFAALQSMGFSALALFVTILGCFVVARGLRLGEEGAAAVAVTVILVVGPQFSAEAIETRLLGVLVGSLVALGVSSFMRPGSPHGRALGDALDRGARAAALLTSIGQTLAGGRTVPVDLPRRWLDEAEEILAGTVVARHAAQDAVSGARWSPMIDVAEAEAVLAQVRITEQTAVTVVSICRDLLAAVHSDGAIPSPLATSLSDVLLATAEAISSQSAAARETPARILDDHTGPVRVVSRSRSEAATHVRGLDDTRPLLLGGSLLRDTEKITETLTGR